MNKIQRIDSELQKLIGQVIQFELNDPRVNGLISVSRVETTQDLKYAKVYVSVYGENVDDAETVNALNVASNYIRSLVMQRIKIRLMPKLTFINDDSIDYAMHMEDVFRGLHKDDDK